MGSIEAEDNQRQQSPPSDWEKAWFAYHFGSSLFAGIVGCLGFFDHPPPADAVASVDDAATAITQAATDILDDIPATLNSALSVLSRMTSPEKPSSPPMFGLLSSSTTTSNSSSGAPSRSPLGSLNRRDNIVSIANLFALAFFQNHEVSDHATPHFAVANDALVLFCSYHGLKVNSAAERRLMHKTLGLVKATQFLICMVDDRINHSYLAPNLFGLSLCLGATFRWGVSSKAKTRMLNSIKNILFLGNASSSSTSTTGGKGRKRGRLASKTMDVVEQQPSIVNEASESSTLGTPLLATTSTTAGKLDPYNRRIPSPAPSDSTLTELPVSAKVEVDIESFLKPDDALNKDDTLPPLLDMNNEWRS